LYYDLRTRGLGVAALLYVLAPLRPLHHNSKSSIVHRLSSGEPRSNIWSPAL